MRYWKRGILTAAFLVLASGVLVLGPSTAGAASANAPNTTTGTFTCDHGLSGTFVAPGNNSHSNVTSWGAAHLTFASGGTGVFVPATFDFTFTLNGVPVRTEAATKGNAPAPDSCSISSSSTIPGPGGGTLLLSGIVTGKINQTGSS
jgi:hypothetical protein